MASNEYKNENMQQKDTEGTFEERYGKLKNIAIKLKRQLAEQKTELQSVEKDNQRLTAERDDQKSKYSNAQILQAELDRIQDLLDSRNKELKLRDSELLQTATQLSETKSQLTDSYEANDLLSATNKELEKKTIKLDAEVENLTKLKNALDIVLLSNEDELSKLRKENSVIQKELSAEMNILKEAYKQSSADLLVEDDEKQLSVVLIELEEKRKTISSLSTEILEEKENMRSLKEQLSLVNEKANMESTRAESLMATVIELRKEISKLNEENRQLLKENATNETLMESTRKELQDEKLKSIEASKSASVLQEAVRDAKHCAETQVSELEEQLVKQKDGVARLQEQMSSIKSDFEAYKARAQSVLKQKAKISDDEYSQVLFERQQLNAQLKDDESTFAQLKCELSTCKSEMVLLRSEKNSLLQMNKSANEEMYCLKETSQKEIDLLREKLRTETEGNRQITDTMSMHVEIANRLKLEIESLKCQHLAEIDNLKERIKLLENSQTDVKGSSLPTRRSPAKETESLDPDEPKFDFSSMIREDGEGSECVEPSPVYHARLYHPPSLEHLISRPLPAESHFDDDCASVATEVSMSEFNKMESKVSSLERSLSHLSNLLSESEAENAKLNQLCDVLKENIRSSSRRELREKHLENNEYLKNVLLKFLHLKTGDEKKRLVPVLQTILQLSPQESCSLMQMATGEDAPDGAAGWASYLHLWSNS